MSTDPVWIIDDDPEDQDIVQVIWKESGFSNELVLLNDAEEAFQRLRAVPKAPFIIICEINLRGTSGFDLRRRLLDTHSKKFKSVPFIYWSAHVTEAQITEAFELSAHGLFIKEGSFGELKDTFLTIIRYWLKSKMPSKTEKETV